MSIFSCSCFLFLYFILHFAGSASVRGTHAITVTIAMHESEMVAWQSCLTLICTHPLVCSVDVGLCAINPGRKSQFSRSIQHMLNLLLHVLLKHIYIKCGKVSLLICFGVCLFFPYAGSLLK